jgi:hypothetical protein
MTNNKDNQFIKITSDIRSNILEIENGVFLFKENVKDDKHELLDVSDKETIIANLTLAYRHLEDARMRIGKAIQAYDGGQSVYSR